MGRRRSTPSLIILIALLFLSTNARFSLSWPSESTPESTSWRAPFSSSRRQLLELVTSSSWHQQLPKGIRAELLHRDHELRSPSSENLSPMERAARDLDLSRRRAEHLNSIGELRIRNGAKRHLIEEYKTKVTSAPGEYVMSISLGTPAQNFVAVIDTGSDLTWLQCSTCSGSCFRQVNRPFQVQNSSTYTNLACTDTACESFLKGYDSKWVTSCSTGGNLQQVGCKYSYFYADSSNTTGDFASDVINLQGLDGNFTKVPNFAFGCSQRTFSPSSLFEGSDGLVGLGQGSISFPAQIGSLYGDVFSYCLVSVGNSRSKSSTMYFGKDASVFNVTGLQYTPLIQSKNNPTFYYVGLEGITVDGMQIPVSKEWFSLKTGRGGVFFDSGTTLTILEPRAMEVLVSAVSQRLNYTRVSRGSGLDYCWNAGGRFESDIKGPKISFNFTGANYELDFENAFILLSDGTSQLLCLAMAAAGEDGASSIIGNIPQRNFHVVYDRVQNRIGWAKKQCSSATTLSFRIVLSLLFQFLVVALLHSDR
ncbi:hypothetical protein R1flu_005074 [Riccia fluitans]|uniref:Peptidase A1 domain-containing protein n=1 Tax=Riccia fluitans TaxID=41844 RepID=A0ABD1YSW9_9MARC